MVAAHDRTRHVGGPFDVAPGDVGFRDVAAAVGTDREHVLLRKAAGQEDQLLTLVVDERGDELLGRAIDHPDLLAGVGIVGGHGEAAREDHLPLSIDLAEDGRAIASRFVRAVRLPDRRSGLLVEGDEVGVAVVIAVDDDLAIPEHGARAIAVFAGESSGTRFPQLLPGEIVGRDEHLRLVEKADVDRFPVRHRRARSVAVEPVNLLHRRFEDDLAPEDLAADAVEAEEGAFALFGGDEKDPVLPDHRRGVADPGDRRLPQRVRRGVELHRQIGSLRDRAVAARTTPARPIFRGGEGAGEENEEEKVDEAYHG